MNLFLPSDPRPIHFVGIAGAGMSALAQVALARGLAVTGSDRDPRPAEWLRAGGAVVHEGHEGRYVEGARVVVASAAVAADHVELARAREAGIPIVPRKEALAGLVAEGRTIGIAGTHGKTTTTVMTTEALRAAGFNPTGLAGGHVAAWGGNALVGGTDWFVVEADEYDQAFLALTPHVAVVNNVEIDHLECYGSRDALEAAFVTFAGRAVTALIGNDGAGADRVADGLGNTVWRFGPGAADIPIDGIQASSEGTRATLRFPYGATVHVDLTQPGLHNLRNAAAALGVVSALGGDVDAAARAIGRFGGVGRRFERLGETAGVMLVDDYAHHPTELRATLAAARQAFPGRRLVAVFQPHLFSRTQLQGEAMGEALAAADLVIVTDVYPAREAPIPGVTGALVADAAARCGTQVVFEPVRSGLAERTRARLKAGDVLLTLGAGDITEVGPAVASLLAGTGTVA